MNTIFYKGYMYEIKIEDSTHLVYRIPCLNNYFSWPLHILQCSEEMLEKINEIGLITDSTNKKLKMRFFKKQ